MASIGITGFLLGTVVRVWRLCRRQKDPEQLEDGAFLATQEYNPISFALPMSYSAFHEMMEADRKFTRTKIFDANQFVYPAYTQLLYKKAVNGIVNIDSSEIAVLRSICYSRAGDELVRRFNEGLLNEAFLVDICQHMARVAESNEALIARCIERFEE